MKKILCFLAVLFLCAPLFADTLRGGYPACLTKELYNQFMNAYMDQNEPELEYLLRSGCGFPQSGLKVALLDYSMLDAKAKVRIFIGDKAVVMWTHYKNVNRKK